MKNKKNLVLRILSYSILLGLAVFSLSSCFYGGPAKYLFYLYNSSNNTRISKPIEYFHDRDAYVFSAEKTYSDFSNETSVELFTRLEANLQASTTGAGANGYTFRATLQPEITLEVVSIFDFSVPETITITIPDRNRAYETSVTDDVEQEKYTTPEYEYTFDTSEFRYYFEIRFFDAFKYRRDIIFRFYI